MRPALAMIVLATTAGSARADIGPFLPFAKHASATRQIEVAEEFADYVCVVHRYSWDSTRAQANEAMYVELAPDRPLVLPLTRTEVVTLILVPRTVATDYPTARELASAALGDRMPGVAVHQFDWRETVPSWGDDEITITYRVRRTSSGGLELVRTSRNPLWQWYAAAGFVTVAVIIGGFLLIRRMLRSRPVATAK